MFFCLLDSLSCCYHRRGATHGTIARAVSAPGYAFLAEPAQVWRRSRRVHPHKGETVIWPACGRRAGRQLNDVQPSVCQRRAQSLWLNSWSEENTKYVMS